MPKAPFAERRAAPFWILQGNVIAS